MGPGIMSGSPITSPGYEQKDSEQNEECHLRMNTCDVMKRVVYWQEQQNTTWHSQQCCQASTDQLLINTA
jgi:hypothetical protein